MFRSHILPVSNKAHGLR